MYHFIVMRHLHFMNIFFCLHVLIAEEVLACYSDQGGCKIQWDHNINMLQFARCKITPFVVHSFNNSRTTSSTMDTLYFHKKDLL